MRILGIESSCDESAVAVLDGRAFVTPDDVKDRVPAVLRHRVAISPELEVEGRSADDVLESILLRITAPT